MLSATQCKATFRASRAPVRAARLHVAAALKVGDKLPAFEVKTDQNTTITSKDIAAAGAVIFVYPQACTSGCTHQANAFKDNSAAFAAKGYKIYGMSADAPDVQAGWKQEHGLNYSLLCDPSKALLAAMGCISPEGKITRAHFVVAPGGAVQDVVLPVGSKDSLPLALAFVSKQ